MKRTEPEVLATALFPLNKAEDHAEHGLTEESEGVTTSDFARAAILEKTEDSNDLQELREAIAHDSGKRFSIDEILDELA